MDDKELLEFAAKAAGIVVHGLADKFVAQHTKGHDALCVANDLGGDSLWNPLTDDGDALRLAVKLNLSMDLFDDCILVAGIQNNNDDPKQIEESPLPDPYVATRRAIVRAAAEIGMASSNAEITSRSAQD